MQRAMDVRLLQADLRPMLMLRASHVEEGAACYSEPGQEPDHEALTVHGIAWEWILVPASQRP